MSACEDKRLLLGALLDGELDAANTIAVEQHLKTCPGCAKAMSEFRAVHEALGAPRVAYPAPEAFRRRLRIAIAAEAAGEAKAKPQRAVGLPWAGWTAGGAVAAMAACAVLVLDAQSGQTQLADDLVSDHVRSLLAEHLTDVATSNKHVVKPWFDGKVTFAPTVVDFADKGFPLAGGRLDYVAGQRAAALVYRRGLHVINVFVWPVPPAGGLAMDRTRNGYNLVHWVSGDLTYWAVSDLDPAELRRFRDLYLAALKT